MNKTIYIIIGLAIITGCDLFSTRAPEAPDSSRSNYETALDAGILISNFKLSVQEKNAELYKTCLADESTLPGQEFAFHPSSEALANFSGMFDDWSVYEEQRAFSAFVSNLPDEINPILIFYEEEFEIMVQDSSVFSADYILKLHHTQSGLPDEYAGSLRMVLKKNSTGIWYIRSWFDYNPESDSINTTWSSMKALYIN